jgi:hypothetical protein
VARIGGFSPMICAFRTPVVQELVHHPGGRRARHVFVAPAIRPTTSQHRKRPMATDAMRSATARTRTIRTSAFPEAAEEDWKRCDDRQQDEHRQKRNDGAEENARREPPQEGKFEGGDGGY